MSRSTHADHLTPGDWEVLLLVARGLSKPQMAEKLHLAYDTIKDRVTNVRLFLPDADGDRPSRARGTGAVRRGVVAGGRRKYPRSGVVAPGIPVQNGPWCGLLAARRCG